MNSGVWLLKQLSSHFQLVVEMEGSCFAVEGRGSLCYARSEIRQRTSILIFGKVCSASILYVSGINLNK